MGATSSSPDDEKEFLEIVTKLKEEDFIDMEAIVKAAANLRTLNCISNKRLQKYYLEEPNNITMLIIKCINTLYTDAENKYQIGSLLILSRLLPMICVSYKNIHDLDWLLAGDEPIIGQLAAGLKAITFKPGLLNPELVDGKRKTVDFWVWKDLKFCFENARYDYLSLFAFFSNAEYFFPNNKDVQKQMYECILLNGPMASRVIKSFATCLSADYFRIGGPAMQYICRALIHDSVVRDSIVDTEILKIFVEILYQRIESINQIIAFRVEMSPIEPDLLIASLLCLLIDDRAEFDVEKLTIVTLRLLQLANEGKILVTNHRICITLLLIITSNKSHSELLKNPLGFSLGTSNLLHNHSINLAIAEACANTLLVPKSSDIWPLILAVIHNVAPFLPSEDNFSAELIINVAKLCSENDLAFDAASNIIRRFVSGGEGRKDMIKNIAEKSPLENQQKQENIMLAADATETADFPMVIDEAPAHIEFIKRVLVQLYRMRNKISLDQIRVKPE